jgi:hypothetical protein
VEEALEYLHTQVQPRNQEKLAELMGYLEKHRTEIIDYVLYFHEFGTGFTANFGRSKPINSDRR